MRDLRFDVLWLPSGEFPGWLFSHCWEAWCLRIRVSHTGVSPEFIVLQAMTDNQILMMSGRNRYSKGGPSPRSISSLPAAWWSTSWCMQRNGMVWIWLDLTGSVLKIGFLFRKFFWYVVVATVSANYRNTLCRSPRLGCQWWLPVGWVTWFDPVPACMQSRRKWLQHASLPSKIDIETRITNTETFKHQLYKWRTWWMMTIYKTIIFWSCFCSSEFGILLYHS